MRRFVKSLVFKRDKPDNHKPASECPPSSASDDGHVMSRKSRKLPHSLRIKSFISSTSSRAFIPSSLVSSPSTPQLSVNGDHVHSSSASSSGSVDANLQTPDDDRTSLLRYPARDVWVIRKRTSAVAVKDRTSRELDQPLSKEWLDHPPQLSQMVPTDPLSRVFDLTDEASTGSDSDHLHVAQVQMTSDVVRDNLRLLVECKLVPVPVSHPLASSTGPLYPRSCNRNADLPREKSMRYTLFQKRLLRHLNETSDAVSLPIVITRRSVPRDSLATLSPEDIPWPSKTLQITPYSVGIRRWIARPCFEDTHNTYMPSSEGIVARQVSGTSLGVPALDYSDALDILADPSYYSSDPPRTEIPIVTVVPPSTPEMTLSPQPPSTTANLMSPSILVRNHVSAIPSPLRHDVLSPSDGKENSRSSNVENVQPANPVRRGVHFADDEDDALPLHLIRMKRKREEKAKFLRSEQRRREVEAWQALRVAEEERRRKDLERTEMERKLRERRAQEEANRQRLYVEEVNATRQRRELNRAGGSSSGSINTLAPSSSTRNVRERDHASKPREPRYSRSSSGHDVTGSSSPVTPPHSSSSSSKAPSVTGQPTPTSNDRSGTVRPLSMHSVNSSEEISQSRRNSAVGQGSLRSSSSRLSMYPAWPNGLFIPPAPYMMPIDPSLSMDMPLLPPVPPFMLQQYPRRSSRGSSNSSSSKAATSANSSSERVDQSRSGHSLPPSPSSSRSSGIAQIPSTHHFSASSEHRRASIPLPTGKSDRRETLSTSHSQSSTLPRGRSRVANQQQQPQAPTPWTALPTKTGVLPVTMPRAY